MKGRPSPKPHSCARGFDLLPSPFLAFSLSPLLAAGYPRVGSSPLAASKLTHSLPSARCHAPASGTGPPGRSDGLRTHQGHAP